MALAKLNYVLRDRVTHLDSMRPVRRNRWQATVVRRDLVALVGEEVINTWSNSHLPEEPKTLGHCEIPFAVAEPELIPVG